MAEFGRTKALAFDYYGTIADKRALASQIDAQHPGQGGALAKHWFATTQRYCFQAGMMERYISWDELTRSALRFAGEDLNLSIEEDFLEELIEADASLPVYDEIGDVLPRLAAKYSLHVLSMGASWMIERSQQNANIDKHFTSIITTRQARIYKPDRRAYLLAQTELGLETQQLAFVSGNSFDVIGAVNAGLPTIWVRRHAQPLDGLGIEPDLVVTNLLAMADALGC